MCGIAGAIAIRADGPPIDRKVVLRLNQLLRRRGPDGEGFWASDDSRVMLGHRRLSIIDVGPSGLQPMTDATGRWVITFNGEIYNYRSLRSELERLGAVFRTQSDTEVLINVVHYWGEAGLRRLRGMYAFALWDKIERELWLVRDPHGIKPLYVGRSGTAVWFASQASALASAAPVNTNRDPAGLTGFYLWGHVPEPFTWWTGIQMLPAGYVQRIRLEREAVPPRLFQFHRVEDAYTARPPRPLQPGDLRQMMVDSVRHHLVADVPVGVFLSAGIDSSVIAALAAELGTRLQTVTLAFDEYIGTADDEAVFAEATAKRLKCDHETVRMSRADFEGILDDFFKSMDQPTIDGLNTYLVSHAAASRGLKVVLSGLGGDELFGGYPSFWQAPKLASMGRHLLRFKGMSVLTRAALQAMPLLGAPPKTVGLLTDKIVDAYILRRALFLESELEALIDQSWVTAGLQRLATQTSVGAITDSMVVAGINEHAQISALETCWYMRNQLLRDADWSSMAHGLELRVPFVDVVLTNQIAPAIASSSPPTKRSLADCVEQVAEEAISRPKTGFTTPVRDWLSALHGIRARGLRGWASAVHHNFRAMRSRNQSNLLTAVGA